jgi:hypothetical protein
LDYIEIEYNNNLVPLEKVLFEVKRPGDFYVHGAVETPMPKVVVKGGKTLSFPLPKARITELVRLADRAPYGRGKDTIVDTAVRNVWQLAAKDVRVSGESWDASFGSILAEAIAGLGCGSAGVSAELYKLLVYDKGGFFLAHRDTEKVSGMFGTLVVTLPSVYEGGELRIRHAGREVTIPTGTPNPSELSYCAFYADCEHEVLPVLKGNRVCLVYNLVQEQKAGKRAKRPKAPEYEGHTAEVAAILDRFLKEPDAPPKIAWLLEHQYSPAGLSFSALKGADFARARVLIEAAKRAGCEVHLAIAHVGESGAAEPEFDSYASRRNRYWYDDEDEEEAEESDNDYSVVDVCDSWKYLD